MSSTNNEVIRVLPRIFNPISDHVEILSDPKIWQIVEEELLGTELREFVHEIKDLIPEFIREGYTGEVLERSNVENGLVEKICYELCEGQNILDAIFEANGWSGQIGLGLAKYQLRKHYKSHQELPTSAEFSSVSRAIIKRRWVDQGVYSWNQLLEELFGETNGREHGYFVGREGLDNAIEIARTFRDQHGRLPMVTDLITIKTKIIDGHWQEFGINKWNDFLELVFGEVNVVRTIDYSEYEGVRGLERAKEEAIEFQKEKGRNPTIKDLSHIYYVISNEKWTSFGITSWNEFLRHATGQINVEHNKYTCYKGIEGLERAVADAKAFQRKTGVMPTKREVKGIYQAIANGYWDDLGIKGFNDFLRKAFGKVNMKANGYFKGEIGLSRALKEGKKFYRGNGRLPVKRDMRTIYSLIYDRGYWKEFGINNWGDFKNKIKMD